MKLVVSILLFILPFVSYAGVVEHGINSSYFIGTHFQDISALVKSGIVNQIDPNEILIQDWSDKEFMVEHLTSAMQILLMPESGNIVFTGASGVGKSYLMPFLLSYINEFGLEDLKSRLYFRVNVSALASRKDGNAGVIEENLKNLINLSKKIPITLIVDEIHTLEGSGTTRNASNDALDHLNESLAIGQIRIIGATTDFQFEHFFGSRPALMQKFNKVKVDPITNQERLKKILIDRYKKYRLKELHSIFADKIIEISSVFGGTFAEPRRSIKILDYLISVERLKKDDIQSLNELIFHISKMYNFDLNNFLSMEKRINLVANAKTQIKQNLIGLDSSIDEFFSSFNYWLKQKNRSKPLAVLIYGEKGAGKTHFSSNIAKYLGFKFLKISMTNITPEELLSQIATQLEMYPFTIFLVDEIEKASEKTQRTFLSIFDSPEITVQKYSSSGQRMGVSTVSTKNSAFVLTTNSGKSLAQNQLSSSDALEAINHLGEIDTYLLDRITKAIAFSRPTHEELKRIVMLKWTEIVANLDDTSQVQSLDPEEVAESTLQKLYSMAHQKNSGGMGFQPQTSEVDGSSEINVSIRAVERILNDRAEEVEALDLIVPGTCDIYLKEAI